jgi:serine/threonine protein kinase/tetratricopeptide (TPR) repeat protein
VISPSRSSPSSDGASSLSHLTAEQRERLSEVLDRYLAALEEDAPLSQEAILAQQPDLAPALKNYFRSLEELHDMAAGFGGGAEPDDANDDHDNAQADAKGEKRVGDYELIREIGRGGMGVVYEARQISLDRRVAVKLLPFAAVLDGKQIARFKHEAQAAAQLHHPNIVPVFAIGVERGVHYYAMQFIDGQPLDRVIVDLGEKYQRKQKKGAGNKGQGTGDTTRRTDAHAMHGGMANQWSAFGSHGIEESVEPALAPTVEYSAHTTQHEGPLNAEPRTLNPGRRHQRPLPSDHYNNVLRLGVQAAEALHAAHEYGVVHRDIKPSNLLVEVGGKLWITDFGLARCQRDVSLTRTGDVVGTMRYMSPEQAAGQSALVDHRSDIYSLGVTLYELATLQPAFPEERGPALLRQIDSYDPPRPRQVRSEMPVDLETVILKAMARERDERYTTAAQLAADLANVLEGKPTAARPPTLLDRAGRWVRRRQRTVAVTLATLLIAVVGLSTSVFMVAGAKNRASSSARQFEALYRQAQEMIDELGMQSAEDLRYVVGAEQQRQRTLQRTIRYLTTLADESKQDKSKQKGHLQKSAAVAYAKIGGLQQQLGLNEQALESYHEAGRMLSQLNEQGTFDVDVQRQLALVENSVGLTLLRQGKLDDARERFVEASQRQERLLARTASNLDVQADLAASLCNLGLVQQQLGQSAAAETSFAAATDRLKHVAAVLPDGNESRAKRMATKEKLASTYGNRAALDLASRPEQAASYHRQAIELLQSAAVEEPGHLDLRRKLATSFDNLATALSRASQAHAARLAQEQAIEVSEELVQQAPARPVFRLDLALHLNNLGMLETRDGRLDAAETAFQRGIALYEEHAKNFPDDAAAISSLGGALNNLGIALEGQDRLHEAAAAFASAVERQQQALSIQPQLPRATESLAKFRANQVRVEQKLAKKASSNDAPSAGLKATSRLDYNEASYSGIERTSSLLSRTRYQP